MIRIIIEPGDQTARPLNHEHTMIYEGRVMWCIDLACRSVWMQTGNEDNDWAGNLYIGRWINEGEEPW